MDRHLRLAAADGRRAKGFRKPRAATKPPPKMLAQSARKIATGIERSALAIGLAFDVSAVSNGTPPTPQAVTIQALTRDALINLHGLANLACYLAEMLEDPSRW